MAASVANTGSATLPSTLSPNVKVLLASTARLPNVIFPVKPVVPVTERFPVTLAFKV